MLVPLPLGKLPVVVSLEIGLVNFWDVLLKVCLMETLFLLSFVVP